MGLKAKLYAFDISADRTIAQKRVTQKFNSLTMACLGFKKNTTVAFIQHLIEAVTATLIAFS